MNNFLKWAESKQGMVILGIGAIIAVAIVILRHGNSAIVAPASNGGVSGSVDAMPSGPMYTIGNPPVSTPSSPDNPTPSQPIPPPTAIKPPVPSHLLIAVGNAVNPGQTTVPNGTTLNQLAAKYGLSLQQLYALNTTWPIQSYDPNLSGNINGLQIWVS